MNSLKIKCSDSSDELTCADERTWAYLRIRTPETAGVSVHLTPATAQELRDWLDAWIESAKFVCGWARVEEQSDDSWAVVYRGSGWILARFSCRDAAIAWVESFTAEVRK